MSTTIVLELNLVSKKTVSHLTLNHLFDEETWCQVDTGASKIRLKHSRCGIRASAKALVGLYRTPHCFYRSDAGGNIRQEEELRY